MSADPRLLSHPAVRAEAERLAREHVGATLSLRGVPVVHGTTPDALVRAEAEVQAALLADVSRPPPATGWRGGSRRRSGGTTGASRVPPRAQSRRSGAR